MEPRIELDPPVVSQGRSACVTVTFSTAPVGSVTIQVKDDTTNPPTTLASDSLDQAPYKLEFKPLNAGDHVVCVEWDGNEAEHRFDVES